MENTNEEVVVDLDNEGEGASEGADDVVTVKKGDYEKLNQTLGSLKRELKDLKKPKEETKETPTTNKSQDNSLVEKTYLRAAGITDKEEVELALSTAKKWGVSIDEVVDDEDFKVKLDKVRTQKSNAIATAGVKSGTSGTQAKNTAEYWIAKGTPPTPSDVADRKTRSAIINKMMAQEKSGSKFYNE